MDVSHGILAILVSLNPWMSHGLSVRVFCCVEIERMLWKNGRVI